MPRPYANDNLTLETASLADLMLLVGKRIAQTPMERRPNTVLLAMSLLQGVCNNAMELP